MALSILFGRKTIKKIGEVELDIAVTEDHQYKNEVTQYPLEDGSVISDHVIERPIRLTMGGLVSNAPIRFLGGTLGALARGEGSNRSEIAFNALLEIWKSKETVDVVTGLVVYPNMVMENFTVPRDRNTGDALRFNAELVQITKVESETVEIPNLAQNQSGPKAGTDSQGQSTVDRGKQTTSGATDQQTGRISLLKRGVTSIGGLF